VRSRYTSTGSQNSYEINDTSFFQQDFRDYYAYDDGTAEKAYGLTGAGLELAYEFDSPIGDSLRAVYFNFPQVLHDDNDELPIRLLVWGNLKSTPLYEGLQWVDPQYTDGNGFFRLELDQAVYVKDTFFIGFRQQESKKIYIGFDANSNAKEYTFYHIGEEWFQSSLNGALMIRPSFSKLELLSSPERQTQAHELKVYPNPTDGNVQLSLDVPIAVVNVIDVMGRTVATSYTPTYGVDLSSLPSGIYILMVKDTFGEVHTQRLILRK
jgi:hypothetical protein